MVVSLWGFVGFVNAFLEIFCGYGLF